MSLVPRVWLCALLALVACALVLPVRAFFVMNSPPLVTEMLDPIVNPGGFATHVHTVIGASNFGSTYDYNTTQKAKCTTMPISVDKSNYWVPQLYYVYPNQTTFEAISLQYGRTYYLPRPGAKSTNITAFPKGLRMVSGNMSRRSYNPNNVADTAVTFVCLDFSTSHNGDPAWEQRNNFFEHNCPDGMRLQIAFQSCWNGVDLYKSDNSHVAYSEAADGGDCPDTHPVKFVNLFFEFIFNVQDYPFNDAGLATWALSNGDTTGYGYHGDFQNGWDVDVLQAALDQCSAAGDSAGDINNCAPLKPYIQDGNAINSCKIEGPILEQATGWSFAGDSYSIDVLPGCNKLWVGNGSKPACAAGWPGLVKPTWVPAKSVLPDNWITMGCYSDQSSSALTGAYYADASGMTNAACAAYCESLNFPLAGTQYGSQCRCGASMAGGASLASPDPDTGCAVTCTGRYTENCGGSGNNTVMFNPTIRAANPSAGVLAEGWFRAGCAVESNGARLLSGASYVNTTSMTPAMCVAFCASEAQNKVASFAVAGTEYAQQCYCASSLPSTATMAPKSDCSMSCKGEQTLPCGGSNRLNLYTFQPNKTRAALNATALPSSWQPLGCFALSQSALLAMDAALPIMDAAMDNSMCANYCSAHQAAYAATAAGTQCYCGTAANMGSSVSGTSLTATQCGSPCAGDDYSRCGGSAGTASVIVTSQQQLNSDDPNHGGVNHAAARQPSLPMLLLLVAAAMALVF